MTSRVLLVDDEKNIRRTLALVLTAAGYECIEAESGEAALSQLEDEIVHAVLLDIGLPGQDGLQTLKTIRRTLSALPVIMISGRATVADAVEATRLGAFDFLEKPLSRDRVLLALRNALQLSALETEVNDLRGRRADERVIVGESPAFLELKERALRVAPTQATVLITGESGTGKELVARFIHDRSPRHDRTFVEVNCAAIPEELIESELFGCVRGAYTGADRAREGRFQAAHGGTLFLDEIGDMSARVQAKVLRAIQERVVERVGESIPRPVDVRIIAATNRDLAADVRDGRFREDLYHRIHVVPLEVPSLRQRSGDVPRLAAHFALSYARMNGVPEPTLTDEALTELSNRPWPGNVRELRNAIERLVILSPGPEIDRREVLAIVPMAPGTEGTAGDRNPDERGAESPLEMVRSLGGLQAARDEFERSCIDAALDASGGNVSEAARLLRVERSNLHKKIAKHELEARPRRSGTGLGAGLLVVLMLLALTTAHAKDDAGFQVGLHALGDWIGAEDPAPGTPEGAFLVEEKGSGGSLFLGYDWSRRFGLALRLSGASHGTTTPELDLRHDSAELELHWRPGSHPDVLPYLFGGLGGNVLRVDTDLVDVETRGASAVLGSGVRVRITGEFWFDLMARLQLVNWNEVEVAVVDTGGEELRVSTPVDGSGSAGQLGLGVVWGF